MNNPAKAAAASLLDLLRKVKARQGEVYLDKCQHVSLLVRHLYILYTCESRVYGKNRGPFLLLLLDFVAAAVYSKNTKFFINKKKPRQMV